MINKETIYLYILEKICNNEKQISKSVAETFGINQNTAHDFIKQLIDKNIILREKRDTYSIVNKETKFKLKSPLMDETFLFNEYVKPFLNSLNDNVVKIWEFTFTEMINNVIDHSQCKTLEITIIQNYLNTSLIIKDDGVGIFNKIKSYFNLPTINDAINELFKGKVTTNKDNHSGEGIFFSSQIMDTFYISSSNHIFTRSKLDNGMIRESNINKGTLVFMSLTNRSRKNLIDIFNMYSSIDEGFNITSIKLTNIFDDDPISRSQAKRLCQGLEKFNKIILDFEGINMIGQAFAHQLFVVFQNLYPNIKIQIKNTNENVLMMIKHVTEK